MDGQIRIGLRCLLRKAAESPVRSWLVACYTPSMDIRIIYCHTWAATSAKAASFAALIRDRLSVPVELEKGRFGQFDVIVNGRSIVSRKGGLLARLLNRPWPESEAVVVAVRQAMRDSEPQASWLWFSTGYEAWETVSPTGVRMLAQGLGQITHFRRPEPSRNHEQRASHHYCHSRSRLRWASPRRSSPRPGLGNTERR